MPKKSKNKQASYKPARYVGKPKIDKIQKQFLAVLAREAQNLLDESFLGKLSETSSLKLHKYLKLMKDLDLKKPSVEPASSDEEEGKDPDLSATSTEDLKKLVTNKEQPDV